MSLSQPIRVDLLKSKIEFNKLLLISLASYPP